MIGIDVTEIRRFREMKHFEGFSKKVFSEEETVHIGKNFERAAGLWAAKEAVAKALGCGFSGLPPIEIRIFHDEKGAPRASARGVEFEISISHEKEYAVAVALRSDRKRIDGNSGGKAAEHENIDESEHSVLVDFEHLCAGTKRLCAVTAQGMRDCDASAIASGTPFEQLMRRAAEALAERIDAIRGELPVVLFCGNGNNGGDGVVAAEILKKRGIEARVQNADEPILELPERFLAADCLFGTGFHGAVREKYVPIFEAMRRAERVIACDIPSGLDADTGRADPLCVRADETITFAAAKYGQFLADGKDFCGDLRIADIGIPIVSDFAEIVCGNHVAELFPARKNNCHKGSFERVFLIGGSAEFQGSVAIGALAEAALRSGCGYATVVCPRDLGSIRCLENTFRFCGEKSLAFDEELFSEIAETADVVVAGMGMGQSEDCGRIVEFLIHRMKKCLVLDADALNLVAKHPEWLGEAAGRLFLTPHPGEFARLCGCTVSEVAQNPLGLADQFAAAHGLSVLLKGVSSYVTDGKTRFLNVVGSPCLAKAGSGDALDGFAAVPVSRGGLAGLAVGSFLHGAAAVLASESLGEHSVLAGDLPKFLPKVRRQIPSLSHEFHSFGSPEV